MGFWDAVMHTNTPITFYRLDVLPDAQPTVSKHWRKTKFSIPDKIPLLQRVQTIKILGIIFTSSLSVKLQTERQLCMHCMSCASMGCVTTHCMISSAQSPSQNSCMHPTPGGILQCQQQTEDLCFHSSLHSHWFLFSRSSRLPRPLHFFGWETI